MTIEEIKTKVEEIKRLAEFCNELAHCEEDALYLNVLRDVAESDHPLAKHAKLALEVDDLNFTRWYA